MRTIYGNGRIEFRGTLPSDAAPWYWSV